MSRLYLKVPFSEKDEAKALGARFCGEKKRWYASSQSGNVFRKWPRFIVCPFAEKDEAKKLGAKFDAEMKAWYVDADIDIEPFSRWLPQEMQAAKSPVKVEKKTEDEEDKKKNEPKKKAVKRERQPAESPSSSQNSTTNTTTIVHNHYMVQAAGGDNGKDKEKELELNKMKSDIKQGCSLGVAEMRQLLKDKGVKGMTNKSKEELINKCMEYKLLSVTLTGPSNGAAAAPPQAKKQKKEKSVLPDDYECPILMTCMTDPVICSDGFSYEREAIVRWLSTNDTSPKTNLPLSHFELIPNLTLKAAIIQWESKNK